MEPLPRAQLTFHQVPLLQREKPWGGLTESPSLCCLAPEALTEPQYGVCRTSSMGCGHHRCPQCQVKVGGPGPPAANLPVPAGIH